MKKRTALVTAFCLSLCIGAYFSEAQAACAVPRLISSVDGSGNTTLSVPGGPFPYTYNNVSYFIEGAFWSLGNGSAVNGLGNDSGTNTGSAYYAAGGWLSANGSALTGYEAYLGGAAAHWAAVGTDGCIDLDGNDGALPDNGQCMVVLLSDGFNPGGGFFAALSVAPDAGGNYFFTGTNGFPSVVDLVPIPEPIVVANDPTTVIIEDVTAGLYTQCGSGIVQGYQIYTQCLPPASPAPTDTDPNAWTLTVPFAPLGVAIPIPTTCPTNQLWVATSLVFDSGFTTSNAVSAAKAATDVTSGVVVVGEGSGSMTAEIDQIPPCSDGTTGSHFGDLNISVFDDSGNLLFVIVSAVHNLPPCPSSSSSPDQLDVAASDTGGLMDLTRASGSSDDARTIAGFPPAGTDVITNTTADVLVEFLGMQHNVTLSGDVEIERGDPHPTTGEIQVEMKEMVLTGTTTFGFPVEIRAGVNQGLPTSPGTITPVNVTAGDFPAAVEFDPLNFQITLPPEAIEPLAIDLDYFTAEVKRRGVLLTWRTLSETDNFGFKIVRKRDGEDPVSITPEIIPSRGNELLGAEYKFADKDRLEPGKYTYYLQDIDLQGRTRQAAAPVPVEVTRPLTGARESRILGAPR